MNEIRGVTPFGLFVRPRYTARNTTSIWKNIQNSDRPTYCEFWEMIFQYSQCCGWCFNHFPFAIWTYLKPLALIAQCFCRHCCILVFESARPGLTTERCWGLAPSHGAKTVGDCLQIISFRDDIDAAALVLWSFTMDMLKTVCQMRCVHYPLQWLGSSCSELWLFRYSLLHSKARMWRLQG